MIFDKLVLWDLPLITCKTHTHTYIYIYIYIFIVREMPLETIEKEYVCIVAYYTS